jgi:thioredoxin-related protein
LILLSIFKRCSCLIVTWAVFAPVIASAFAMVIAAVPAAAQLLPAADLAQAAAEARTRRTPVLLAFMEQSCPYCAVARRDYLVPLQSDPQWKSRVLIREIEVDRSTPMRDFAGTATTHREFARSLGIKRVPTLIVFDADGQRVAPPITGLLADDFYRLYIEQAIEAGLTRMRPRGR